MSQGDLHTGDRSPGAQGAAPGPARQAVDQLQHGTDGGLGQARAAVAQGRMLLNKTGPPYGGLAHLRGAGDAGSLESGIQAPRGRERSGLAATLASGIG